MLFACIFVPDLPAAAIVRNEPELRGQAVAVVDGTPPLLRVIAANERARRAGVETGMTKLQALARLAGVAKSQAADISAIRRRSRIEEEGAHAALADCARGFSPRVEEVTDAPEMVLVDVAGLDRLFGSPRTIAAEVSRRASNVGLEANVAVAANLDAAICAARGFQGITIIQERKQAEQLAPLPIDVLLQNGTVDWKRAQEMLETFDRWGIRTLRAFAALPEVAVSERLGPDGVYLQKLARGEGKRTLAPTDAPLTFEEAMELEHPIEDMEALAFVLNRLIERLCQRLTARSLSTNELRLWMQLERCGEYDAGSLEEKQNASHGFTRRNADQAESPKTSKGTTSIRQTPHARSSDCYERAIRLPVPMLDAKTFLRLWQLELRGHPPGAPVAKIWLHAEAVQPRFTQGGLFLTTAPEPERLELTLARIAGVVRVRLQGAEAAVRVGSAEVLDTHKPDAFRVKRFVPPQAEERRGRNAKGDRTGSFLTLNSRTRGTEVNHSRQIATALRRFRPPVRVSVEVKEGRPAWVRAGRARTDVIADESEVVWCAGPWRSSGEWWEEVWSREEWDVGVESERGRIFCRMYRDGMSDAWFVEGTYD